MLFPEHCEPVPQGAGFLQVLFQACDPVQFVALTQFLQDPFVQSDQLPSVNIFTIQICKQIVEFWTASNDISFKESTDYKIRNEIDKMKFLTVNSLTNRTATLSCSSAVAITE